MPEHWIRIIYVTAALLVIGISIALAEKFIIPKRNQYEKFLNGFIILLLSGLFVWAWIKWGFVETAQIGALVAIPLGIAMLAGDQLDRFFTFGKNTTALLNGFFTSNGNFKFHIEPGKRIISIIVGIGVFVGGLFLGVYLFI